MKRCAEKPRAAQTRRLIAEQHWEDRKTRKSFRVEYEVHGGEYVK